MRIRRKKHLEERLNMVKDYLIVADRDIVNVLEAIKDKKYIDFDDIFGNSNPVELEIGCGKGGFIIEMAKAHPEKNFIAVEMLENIVVMACEKAKKENINNLIFFNSGAEYLPRYIKEDSISNIYLNFSPPYPQESYSNRRLSSDRFAKMYYDFLKKGGSIYQKTDDKGLFEYSVKKFTEYGFSVSDITDKLSNNLIENIQTEYEKKFRNLKQTVYGLIATKL